MSKSQFLPALISTGKTITCTMDTSLKRVISISRTIIPGLNVHVLWEVDKTAIKAESIKRLQALVDSGIPQKWAAYICGVSQSYASKLLRSK